MTQVDREGRKFEVTTNLDNTISVYELTPTSNLQALLREGEWNVRGNDGHTYYIPNEILGNFLNDICIRAQGGVSVK